MRSAIEIGDLVWNGYSGRLRFGRVTGRRIAESGWAYYTVDWLRDEKYQKAIDYYYSINPKGNYGLIEYKAGQLHRVTPERLTDIMQAYSADS